MDKSERFRYTKPRLYDLIKKHQHLRILSMCSAPIIDIRGILFRRVARNVPPQWKARYEDDYKYKPNHGIPKRRYGYNTHDKIS